jgi:hypothetical protein
MLMRILKNSERGQAIVLIALAIVGLIAIVGLMVDGGVLFIEYARLKRGIDAAAVSAALSFREETTEEQLSLAAQEFLKLNQSDVFNPVIDICERDADGIPSNPTQAAADPALCTASPRKLVRVTATRHVEFGFLPVLGIRSTDITATSIGEAASLDMVLVIDTSSSMSYETDGDPNQSSGDDPAACNATFTCRPLEDIKIVINNPATINDDLLDTLFFPYDRVAVVALTSQDAGGTRNPYTVLHLSSNEASVRAAVASLKVFQPPVCDTVTGPCLLYDGPTFVNVDCPARFTPPNYDPSSCTSSNVGGAMLLAGNEFAGDTSLGVEMREDSLWVVIALVGGPANASDAANAGDTPLGHNQFGHCPQSTWPESPLNPTKDDPNPVNRNPACRDALATTRHCSDEYQASCVAAGGTYDPENYDADDFARDMADFVADPIDGQGATIFTIGLGDLVIHAPSGQPDSGEVLLQYMARTAGDQNTGSALVNHGEYYFAPTPDTLAVIFQQITDNIFTRISQ